MREPLLEPAVKVGAEVDAVVEFDEAVVAEQVTLRSDRSA
jgi:hypothetical protein